MHARGAEPCTNGARTAIALAVDVSASIDDAHWRLQRRGYMEALCSADVLQAIRETPRRRVALALFEWASAPAMIAPSICHVAADTSGLVPFATARALLMPDLTS